MLMDKPTHTKSKQMVNETNLNKKNEAFCALKNGFPNEFSFI